MPSADDVYITPASQKIEWYDSSAVKGNIFYDTMFRITGTAAVQLKGAADSVYISAAEHIYSDVGAGATYSHIWRDDTNGETMRLSNGKLGIGTTSPSYPLHVAQGTATYGIYMPNSNSRGIRFGDTSNNGTGYGRIEGIGGSLFLGSTQVYTSIIGTGDATTTLGSQNRRWSYFFTRFGQVGYDTSTTSTAQFGISGAADKVPLEVYANGATAPALHVTSGSLVGIGTTSPDDLLHVLGGDVDPSIKLENNRSGHNGHYLMEHRGSTLQLQSTGSSVVPMRFTIQNTEMMRLNDTGLGIGTTAPNTLLEVLSTTNEKVRFSYDASNYLGVSVNSGGDSQLEAKTGHLTLKTDTAAHNIRADSKGDFRVDLGDSAGTYTMRVRAADSSAVFMAKSNGLIGIGTESPSRKLEVNAGSSTAVLVSGTGGGTYGVMRVVDTADTTALELVGQRADGEGPVLRLNHESASVNNGDYVGTINFEGYDSGGARSQYAYIRGRIRDTTAGAEDGSLYFQVAEGGSRTDVMTLSGTNVGIGTTSPSEKLDVRGNSLLSGSVEVNSTTGIISDNGSGHTNKLQLKTAGGDVRLINSGTSADMHIQSGRNTHFTDASASTTFMSVKSDGKVGIGTTSPNSKMTVQGDLDIPVNSRFRAGSGGANTGLDIYFNYTDSNSVIENRPSGGDLVFRQMHDGKDYIFKADNDSGTEQEIMRIDGSNASVGIGTTSPAQKLDVNGATQTGDLIVTGSTLAVQRTMKNDITTSTTLSDSYSVYQALADGGGVGTVTLTAPSSPSTGDTYLIVAGAFGNPGGGGAPTLTGLVRIIANTGQTINGVNTNITLMQSTALQPEYKTAHLVCVDTDTWVMTLSAQAPVA